ncbi:MAG TPA: DUF4399 domain-containing protein [Steroidobacteraceae bacterium]|nr:DUF4399 domain-containing protein [Steroidobacteraceae bacterium]HQX77300.1 DUF4399 domain-containing protein [Steroidobacteraceae bacterium]HQZ79727.1 DUF4399 domain-containing protein [Steroidobacteraceae bacterium]
MRSIAVGLMLACASLIAQADAPRTPAPAGAEVYFESPSDGATIKGPVTVRFGLKGMGVAPAGIRFDNTGHHHLLIDTDVPTDLGQPLPATEHIVHFGKGQTETTITLPPGRHTLQLVLGDALHIPHDPPVISKKITITVKSRGPASAGG